MQRPVELESTYDRLPRESFGELLSELANTSAGLIRDEISLATQEMREKVKSLRSGILVVCAAVIVAMLALQLFSAAAVIALAGTVGAANGALIVGLALSAVGAILALIGLRRIKRNSLRPLQTIETLEEDRRWLKELT